MTDIEEYIAAHIDPEPENLRQLNRYAQTSLLYGHMCSGHIQGRLLKMLTQMIRPRRVLELGTYVGYSALCVAQGLPDGAEIITVEVDDEMESLIRGELAKDPAGDKVRLVLGDAAEVVPTLEGEFDMVILDANKRNYIADYEMVLPRVAKGGFILADNTLWGGKVLDMKANHDELTRGIDEFNHHVGADQRVEKVIVPVRDGLTLIRKL